MLRPNPNTQGSYELCTQEIRSENCNEDIAQEFEELLVDNLPFWKACALIRQGNLKDGAEALKDVFADVTDELAKKMATKQPESLYH